MGWVKLVALAGMLSCLPSCGEGGDDIPSAPGAVNLYLTDAPADFVQVWVTLDRVQVHKSGGPWETIPLVARTIDSNGDGLDDAIPNPDGSVTTDLLALRGVETLFSGGVVEAGHYTQIRLRVLSAEAFDGVASIPLDKFMTRTHFANSVRVTKFGLRILVVLRERRSLAHGLTLFVHG
ncbi:MAG: DUF4382 domain-containing protein [Planctomycetota bacterium]|nr:DUF4382 domain-containing protein [Planctomycetota bacterium]